MKFEILTKLSEYYGDRIDKFGACPMGVDWKDEPSQKLRFEQLLRIINNDKPLTINDLGCGYGALYLYLEQNNFPPVLKYYGYDISEKMLKEAGKLIKIDNVDFQKSDKILFDSDYSITSGIFNVKLDTKEKVWEEFITDTLINMNEKSLRGFAFNCLTSYVDFEVEKLYYGDPLFYFDFCRKNFSKYVTLIHDYKLYEWTILVRKNV